MAEPGVPHPRIEFYTLRLEKPFRISNRWELATRCDLPFAHSNFPSPDNPHGDYECGWADTLSQGILLYTARNRWSLLAGLRVVWPTASRDELGLGKIQMIPIAGLSCQLPEISKGSSFTPIVRYATDVGGYGGRLHISQLQFRPMLNIELPKGWTATLFPSADIIINLADHSKLFLPFDAMLSKSVTKNTVAYVEVGLPIIKEFRYYDFKILTGISVSF